MIRSEIKTHLIFSLLFSFSHKITIFIVLLGNYSKKATKRIDINHFVDSYTHLIHSILKYWCGIALSLTEICSLKKWRIKDSIIDNHRCKHISIVVHTIFNFSQFRLCIFREWKGKLKRKLSIEKHLKISYRIESDIDKYHILKSQGFTQKTEIFRYNIQFVCCSTYFMCLCTFRFHMVFVQVCSLLQFLIVENTHAYTQNRIIF